MPPYHSNLNEANVKTVCNMSILPLKTKFKGPAPPCPDGKQIFDKYFVTNSKGQEDIIDEAINYFKANVLFRNYEVKGPADRVLIYLTLYISACLLKMEKQSKGNADKAMYQLAIENFALPGDKNFVLGGIVTNPANRSDQDLMRQYFTQLRQETGQRLIARVYKEEAQPDKWWMCFNKRKFLNKAL